MEREGKAFPFEDILVGLTATKADEELLEYARLLSGLTQRLRFRFVHVLGVHSDAGDRAPRVTASEAFDTISVSVSRFFPETSRDTTVSCHVVEGPRIDRLLEFAVLERSDLILVGHRPGRTGRRSMTRRLAMKGPCSVWVVPAGAPLTISRVMAAVDFSAHSAEALSAATGVCSGARLDRCTSLTIYFNDLTIGWSKLNEEIIRTQRAEWLRFLHPLELHGITVEPVFEEGYGVAGTILAAARRQGADLIVMGTRGRSPSAAVLLGSESEQVIMETRVPVLIVKPVGEREGLLQALLSGKLRTEHVAAG